MKTIIFLTSVFLLFQGSAACFAATEIPVKATEVVPEEKPETVPVVTPAPVGAFDPLHRELKPWHILANYSYFDSWIPSKLGLTVGFFSTRKGAFEINYMKGELALPFLVEDLGRILDERFTIVYRSFSGRRSFNLFYGINYNSLQVQLGNKYIAALTDNQIPQVDLVSFANLGLTFGLGNRWQHKSGFVVGIDWIQLNLPIVNLKSDVPYLNAEASETRKEEIRDVIDVWEKLPTFAVLKIQVGISF